MSSLIKSLALAGLASEAKAMLLKKGCSNTPLATKDVDADFCGALGIATTATGPVTLSAGDTAGSSFKLKVGDADATNFACTDVTKCKADTGKKADEKDTDAKAANSETVIAAFKANTAAKVDNADKLKTEFCHTGTPEKPKLDMCGLYVAAKAAKSKPTTKHEDDNKVKVGDDVYKCDTVQCDKNSGLIVTTGGEQVGPAQVDTAYGGHKPDPTIEKACGPQTVTANDLCKAMADIKAANTAQKEISKAKTETDKKFSFTLDGANKQTYSCEKQTSCNEDGSSGGGGSTTVDVAAIDTEMQKTKKTAPAANAVRDACADVADTQPATPGLCDLVANLNKNAEKGAGTDDTGNAGKISVQIKNGGEPSTKITYDCVKTGFCNMQTGKIMTGAGDNGQFKELESDSNDVVDAAKKNSVGGATDAAPTIKAQCDGSSNKTGVIKDSQ